MIPAAYDPKQLPLLTSAMPGAGGAMEALEDFQVEELPAYLPCGEGQHCMALVRKRGVTTPDAVHAICLALGIPTGAAGYAGMKDRQGVTTQWISLDGVDPARVLSLDLPPSGQARSGQAPPSIEVLQAERHKNKLRTGHLRGNRFTVVLRGGVPDAVERARATLDRLVSQGLPNYFGAQRFGNRGDNAEQGLRMLSGEANAPRQKFKKRLFISAVQSWLFNAVLAQRIRRGCQDELLGGEVLMKRPGSGLFVSEDAGVDGPRLAQREVVITGPICGPRTSWPAEGSPARALEDEVLEACGMPGGDLGNAGRLGRGGRRALLVFPEQAEAVQVEQGVKLTFALPSGSYATALLREICEGGTL